MCVSVCLCVCVCVCVCVCMLCNLLTNTQPVWRLDDINLWEWLHQKVLTCVSVCICCVSVYGMYLSVYVSVCIHCVCVSVCICCV